MSSKTAKQCHRGLTKHKNMMLQVTDSCSEKSKNLMSRQPKKEATRWKMRSEGRIGVKNDGYCGVPLKNPRKKLMAQVKQFLDFFFFSETSVLIEERKIFDL